MSLKKPKILAAAVLIVLAFGFLLRAKFISDGQKVQVQEICSCHFVLERPLEDCLLNLSVAPKQVRVEDRALMLGHFISEFQSQRRGCSFAKKVDQKNPNQKVQP
jgi:hypothetical protein